MSHYTLLEFFKQMKAVNYFVQNWFILFKTAGQAEALHKKDICFPDYNHKFACEEIAPHRATEHKLVGRSTIAQCYLIFRKELIVTDMFTELFL